MVRNHDLGYCRVLEEGELRDDVWSYGELAMAIMQLGRRECDTFPDGPSREQHSSGNHCACYLEIGLMMIAILKPRKCGAEYG